MKSLYDAMLDPALFGHTFSGPTFANWRCVAKILDGLPLDPQELELYRQVTGRDAPPTAAFTEAYFIIARRSGKTQFAAALGLHAALCDYRALLGRGEVATVAMIASDRRQARQLMNYTKGLIDDSPVIAAEVVGETTESISFAHRVQLEIHTTSFRSTRGYSYACVILDELAFFRDDTSANPDVELIRAVRPGLANLRGRLLGLSSPHSRRGHLYAMYQQHYGKASDVLLMRAAHTLLNPTIDTRVIDRAIAEDPQAARSEWLAQFRDDISAFLPEEAIAAALPGRLPRGQRMALAAFVDMSGGIADASCLAIAHSETIADLPGRPIVVLDHLQVRDAPHEPDAVVEEFARTLADYGLKRVTGDRYSAQWVVGSFAKHGIKYEPSDLDKSSIYGEVAPLFAERRVQLLDDARLIAELRLLERRPRSGGRADLVDHPPRAHDDAANAVAGALTLALKESGAPIGDSIRRSSLLAGDQPVELPLRPQQVSVVAVMDAAGAVNTVYLASRPGRRLVLIDWGIERVEGAVVTEWLPTVCTRARELADECRALNSVVKIFLEEAASAVLLRRVDVAGVIVNSFVTDQDVPERVMGIMRYIQSDDVKIARLAYEKTVRYEGVERNHLLAQVLSFDGREKSEGGLLHAFALAIDMALDNERPREDSVPPLPPPTPPAPNAYEQSRATHRAACAAADAAERAAIAAWYARHGRLPRHRLTAPPPPALGVLIA